MPWPLDAGVLADLTAGLETVLVVEDKLPFIESQLREALYRRSHQPLILGKYDSAERPLLPAGGQVGADDVADALATLLADSPLPEAARQRLDARRLLGQLSPVLSEPGEPRRTPYFCSGCPHNVSTRAGVEQLVGAGIGCHTMVALDRTGAPRSGAGDAADGRRGRAVDRPGAVLRRAALHSRTSVTGPSTTRARWLSAPRSPRA